MGEIILGDVSVKAGLEPPAFCGSLAEMVAEMLAVDDDEVAVAAAAVVDVNVDVVAIDVVGEMVGSLSIVVADVTAAVAVDVVAIDEGDDERNVAFFRVTYDSVALPRPIGGLVVTVLAEEAFLMAAIGVVFFPLTGSSGLPAFDDDDAGTADAVMSRAKKTQHWMARILDLS